MAAFDEVEYEQALLEIDQDHQRVETAPTRREKLMPFTIVCLILNRTIGSGIFVTPSKVLNGTGSVAAALLLWAAGGIISMCGLLVWLELGLTIPLKATRIGGELKSVPRSGGEKNYIEFIYSKPRYLATCMYGAIFILLGNLSGNAIAFGKFCLEAGSVAEPTKGATLGIAIAALSVCILLHMFSRRGGILMNNLFASVKVLLLLAIIILGFIKAGDVSLGGDPPSTDNFDPHESFKSEQTSVVSYADSILYVIYAYSGFEQPFYVLSEVARPRKNFPRYTITAVLITTVLFVLVNVAYFCAVPKDVSLGNSQDIATLFLGRVFGNDGARRAMDALIAFSIFGNLVVMTFTAARVKQEIAKEGILPFSLFFATSHTTPVAWLSARFSSKKWPQHLEQTPMAALGLHWFSSVFLIAVTSVTTPEKAYTVLVNLYSYVIVAGLGLVVSGGLLMLYIDRSRQWRAYRNFKVLFAPLHAIIYFTVCIFVLYASFAKPPANSPFSAIVNSGIQWFIVPAIGQSTWLWGVIWFAALHLFMRYRRKELVVTRLPYIEEDPDDHGQWIQRAEIVTHELHARERKLSPPSSMEEARIEFPRK